MLSVQDLAVARGGITLLEGLNFAVEPGQALIVRGPNGSGKTTLLRTLAGLQPAQVGHITGDMDQIAYAAHADGTKSTLTVTENLTFWAEVFGTKDISPAVDAYNLHMLAARPAGALSAGQKRRLGLARMLVTGRPIWVFDEPTVSLDSSAVDMFAKCVEGHLATGGASIIATHIDLGLDGDVFDVTPFKAKAPDLSEFDEVFS